MGHTHGHSMSAAGKGKSRLKIVVIMTLIYLFAEVVGGIWTQSLALLADAGHMLTDVAGLILALFAIRMAEKPASPERTYGYYRAEILAALANAIVLIGISIYILFEAYERFQNPPTVASGGMLLVAFVGLLVNVVGIFLLRESSKESLNMKGAYFEVLSDLLTSVGVIIAAIVMWTTGWYYADPLISAGIGLFILPRTWILLKDAVGILLEGTPANINLAEVRTQILAIPEISAVHDLHVWSLTSGMNALSAHVVRKNGTEVNSLLSQISQMLKEKFKIAHTTIQAENPKLSEEETHL